ncbi:MAG: hypothetical protein KAS66_03770 [Candidatus Omnitrophica bacterium]|nr:hypothetical protein [Candidatus Omnitrophota bacterium]
MAKGQEVRKIGVTGKTNTYYVTLPKDVVRRLKWRKGQKVVGALKVR